MLDYIYNSILINMYISGGYGIDRDLYVRLLYVKSLVDATMSDQPMLDTIIEALQQLEQGLEHEG